MTATVSPGPELLQQVLVDCERHLSGGNLAAALQALNEAVSLNPENAELLGHRGRLALIQGDTDSAHQDFSAALKLNPQCAPAFSGLARLHLESGNVMEAEFNAYRALGLDAGDEDAAAVLRAINPQRATARAEAVGVREAHPGTNLKDGGVTKNAGDISLDSGLTLKIGAHSYIHDSKIRNPSGALTHLRIGNFCSIATELTIIGYDHHSEWITMYPFLDDANRQLWPGTNGIPYPQEARFGSNKSRGDITVGNDVWIGYGVKIFKGVTIGNGAVIGACSLVNKSVEPYTIVAGTPARPIRKRFSESEIAVLEKICWWSWPPEMINRHMPLLCSANFAELERTWENDPLRDPARDPAAVRDRAGEFLVVAEDACARNDLPAAVAAFQRAVELRPNDADLHFRLASAALLCDQTEVFEQALRWTLELDPTNASALRLAPRLTPAARSKTASVPAAGARPAAPHSPGSALASLQQFHAKATDYFADVEPPQLSELQLCHSRILPSREDILPLMPKGGVCAEVGTQTGCFAKKIFSCLKPAKLHIFDLDFTPFDQPWFEPAIRQGAVELHAGDSSSLLGALPDRHFDFIYIDGDHAYDGVVRDLRAAAQKIKEDGWIVCNDYTIYSPLEGTKYGVYRAVNEFCLHHGFEILYLGLHRWGYHDVAIRKRRE